MAKGKRRSIALSFLLLSLLFASHLRLDLSPLHLWKHQLSYRPSTRSNKERDGAELESSRAYNYKLALTRLVRAHWASLNNGLQAQSLGRALRELTLNGLTCISDTESDLCLTSSSVRIATASGGGATVFLAAGQKLPLHSPSPFTIRPYPRRTDPTAMARTSAVALVAGDPSPCNFTHPFPAIVFSAGGFAGNFFHDINDVLIPLFLTSSPFRSRAHLFITDLRPFWLRKFGRILLRLSPFPPISPSVPAEVHCFPAAVIGLKYHGNLLCNETEPPGFLSTADFREFLRFSLSLSHLHRVAAGEKPLLVLISRKNSRVILNEDEVVEMAGDVGFKVAVVSPEKMAAVEEFAAVVNGCGVLMGVHGAGLANMVFLPTAAAILQVVPWGLDWAATAYYGRPAKRLGLKYMEYHITIKESTLYDKYPRDHPVIADPWSINLQGYNISRPVYTDGQNLTLDLVRFRDTLVRVWELLQL
ncbi:hypothetical protein AXF42_Ash007056 [Apostasia shenzhenica]|uniref:Glycosyltransferase 61 catalytic domain-containing protein n=1 Tax=Apostasia shenzhenica TaxID=1088818 RepID=A0A2I0BEZ1_9ASPA|nr:hypothetical protein AXF42_Ash007056 [Apostasia shenzhenica]